MPTLTAKKLERFDEQRRRRPRHPESYTRPINVVYTNDEDVAFRWVQSNLLRSDAANNSPRVLGLDVESTPRLPWREDGYRSDTYFGPATIQLSTVSEALVLQIAQDGHGPIYEQTGLPDFVHDVLRDDTIIKTGLAIDDDMVELYRWCRDLGASDDRLSWALSGSLRRFDMGGIGSSKPGSTVGLARLVAGVLGVALPKSKKLARSHWSGVPLGIPEVDYAARDAWAAAAVLDHLGGLDADRFSPGALCARLDELLSPSLSSSPLLRSIEDVSDRAVLRRAAKQEWKSLRPRYDENGEEVVERTESDRERYKVVTKELRDLAPMPPIPYEIEESLGLIIP
eukprot:jgi/Psemu1/288865/fgenesh1_pg.295_\